MDDFDDLRDDDFSFDNKDLSSDMSDTYGEPDQFDQLRETSARSETLYNDINDDAINESGGGSGFSLSSFTPGQQLILAVLVVLNVLMIGFGLLVIAGAIGN